MIGSVELRGWDGFPHAERNARAWCALGHARLPKGHRPSPEYEMRLVALQSRFLGPGSVPTLEEFGEVVSECLNELRSVHYPNGVAVVSEHAAAWEAARNWLKAADEFAAETLT
jgi:hypothetical protein